MPGPAVVVGQKGLHVDVGRNDRTDFLSLLTFSVILFEICGIRIPEASIPLFQIHTKGRTAMVNTSPFSPDR